MYSTSKIKTAVDGLIGWHQNLDPEGYQLTDLTTSSSGLWFNSVHPALTIDNLISIATDFRLFTFSTWLIGTTYALDAKVTLNGVNYISLQAANTGNDPEAPASAFWSEYIPFTEWLEQRTDEAILECIAEWFSMKSELFTANNLVERKKLFQVTGDLSKSIVSDNAFVGFELLPSAMRSLCVTVVKAGFQFEGANNFKLKLFSSKQLNQKQTLDVAYAGTNGAGSLEWFDVNWQLNSFEDDEDDSGAAWYIGYDQADLTNDAVNGIFDKHYGANGSQAFPSGRYYGATAFSVANAQYTPNQLWALNQMDYTVDTNYGMNLVLKVQCDYTQFIIEQIDLFKDAFRLKVGIKLLEEIANNASARSNRHERNFTKDSLTYDLQGDNRARHDNSLIGKYKKEMKAIEFDRTNIESICLPCKRRGIRHKTIGVTS